MRAKMLAEYKKLEDIDEKKRTAQQRIRMNELLHSLKKCICRFCTKEYNEDKSRADYKGYCSMACQHDMSKRLGYSKRRDKSEYAVLEKAKCVGSKYVIED